METDCQESLHEYQQQMEPSESVEGIEYRLWVLRNDVEHDDELDESESSQQSRKKRKKKPCTDKMQCWRDYDIILFNQCCVFKERKSQIRGTINIFYVH